MSDQIISALIGAFGICVAAVIGAKAPAKTVSVRRHSISMLIAIGIAGVAVLVASTWLRGPQGAPGGLIILASGKSANQNTYGDTFELTVDGLLITTASTISSYSRPRDQLATVSLSVFIDLFQHEQAIRIAHDSSAIGNNSLYTLRASTAAVRTLKKGRYQISASTDGGSDDVKLDFSYVVLSLAGNVGQQ